MMLLNAEACIRVHALIGPDPTISLPSRYACKAFTRRWPFSPYLALLLPAGAVDPPVADDEEPADARGGPPWLYNSSTARCRSPLVIWKMEVRDGTTVRNGSLISPMRQQSSRPWVPYSEGREAMTTLFFDDPRAGFIRCH